MPTGALPPWLEGDGDVAGPLGTGDEGDDGVPVAAPPPPPPLGFTVELGVAGVATGATTLGTVPTLGAAPPAPPLPSAVPCAEGESVPQAASSVSKNGTDDRNCMQRS